MSTAGRRAAVANGHCRIASGQRTRWAVTWHEAWEAARGLYSVALVIALVLVARFAPLALRVLAGLSEALTLAARALMAASASADALARVERKVDEIHAAVVKRPD
jgi:hypothetical protein